jgi:hypothetical protein
MRFVALRMSAHWPVNRPSFVHARRPFVRITPPMCGLNIVWMVIAPGSAHSFWLSVVGHYVVVVREFFKADRADPVLLNNLPLE